MYRWENLLIRQHREAVERQRAWSLQLGNLTDDSNMDPQIMKFVAPEIVSTSHDVICTRQSRRRSSYCWRWHDDLNQPTLLTSDNFICVAGTQTSVLYLLSYCCRCCFWWRCPMWLTGLKAQKLTWWWCFVFCFVLLCFLILAVAGIAVSCCNNTVITIYNCKGK